MRRGADLEALSRLYGRNGLAAPLRAARRLVGGLVFVALAAGQGPDLWALARLWGGAPVPPYSSVAVSALPLAPLAWVGGWDLTPTREGRLALSLGLGLGVGLRLGGGVAGPAAALAWMVVRGLVWGLALRAAAPFRQAMLALVVGSGGAGWGAWAALGLCGLALGAAAAALRPLRRGPLRAAVEGALLEPQRPGLSLAPARRGGANFVSTLIAASGALVAGLGLGVLGAPLAPLVGCA